MKKHNGHKHPVVQPIDESAKPKRPSREKTRDSQNNGGSRQGNAGHEGTSDGGNNR